MIYESDLKPWLRGRPIIQRFAGAFTILIYPFLAIAITAVIVNDNVREYSRLWRDCYDLFTGNVKRNQK